MSVSHHEASQATPKSNVRGVVVRGSGEGFAQEISAGQHRLRSDEPASSGGTDTGPTPYDLLLAALGSCTSMTVAMYARRRNWPLTEVSVSLRHSRRHATDCADCESNDVILEHIDRDIHLSGNLDSDQIAKLLEIADKCPLHRTLTSKIEIQTRIV